MMMAVGHAFRRSRSFQLFLSLIFTGEVVFALARPHTSDNHDFTRFPLYGPSIGLFDRAVAYNQTLTMRPPLHTDYQSQRVFILESCLLSKLRLKLPNIISNEKW